MSHCRRPWGFVALGILGLSAAPLHAELIRVPDDAPTCSEAVSRAADGDVILVAPGEHVSAEPIDFRGKKLTLRSEGGPESTTLRMADAPADPLRASVIILESGERDVLIEGLTIRGGRGTQWGDGHSDAGGGGILIRNGAAAAVKDCIIIGNKGENGGGIQVAEGGTLELDRCGVSGNWSTGLGGGILFSGSSAATTVSRSSFAGNSAASGGALFFLGASGTVSSCEVMGNYADSVAGGMCCLFGSSPRIERTVFLGNTAFGGGAISCESADDNPVLVSCLIAGNFAIVAGACQFRDGSVAELIHCTVTRNGAQENLGGLSCREGATPRIRSSIVEGNFPESLCGELSSTLTGAPAQFVRLGDYDFERTITVEMDGFPRLLPNFIRDPGDYELKPGSPAIEAADPLDGNPPDVTGKNRPCGALPDQGAYERCTPSTPGFVRGDANADSNYDIGDPVFTLSYLFLGDAAPPCASAADTDASETLEITDAVRSLNYLFNGAAAPPAPFPECGEEPGAGTLGCEEFPPCGS